MLSEKGINFLREIERDVQRLGDKESDLELGFAHLGYQLLEVSEMHYWEVHYPKFKDYLGELAKICGRTPDQLQRYMMTVRDLIDTYSIVQIESMGITKAMRLRSVKDLAVPMPKVIDEAALDPEVSDRELKKVIQVTLKMPTEEQEPSEYMDLECEFMVNPEQRATLEAAIHSAMHTDPVTRKSISKSAQMLDVMLKFSMEWLSTHGAGE